MLYYLHHSKFGWIRHSPFDDLPEACRDAATRGTPSCWTIVGIDGFGTRRKKLMAVNTDCHNAEMPAGLPKRNMGGRG